MSVLIDISYYTSLKIIGEMALIVLSL